jgi:ABC-2 type transport system ATP-binding protein
MTARLSAWVGSSCRPGARSTGRIVTNVVEAEAVVKRWGSTPVLTGATFTIGHGVTGLLGANGAGKTTVLGMVLGLHHPNDGRLSVLGLDPTKAGPAIRERIGYSPEHHLLPPDIPAHDLVRHIAEVHGLPKREATARASDALYQVGLGEERFRPIGTMSTGQRQRVKLAQAIAHDPALVLLDEPTDGLDPVQRDQMLGLIRRVGAEFGIDIILSSHLLEEVERVCDGAVILSGGQVVASGPLDQLTGATGGLVVDLDGDLTVAARVADVLRHWDVAVELDGRRLLVSWPAGDDDGSGAPVDLHDVVRDAVVHADAGIRRLSARRLSLEDVVLEVGR